MIYIGNVKYLFCIPSAPVAVEIVFCNFIQLPPANKIDSNVMWHPCKLFLGMMNDYEDEGICFLFLVKVTFLIGLDVFMLHLPFSLGVGLNK